MGKMAMQYDPELENPTTTNGIDLAGAPGQQVYKRQPAQQEYDRPNRCCPGVRQDLSDCTREPLVKSIIIGSCCGVLVILAIILIACSLERIEATEVGLEYNSPQGSLSKEYQSEGLHAKAPFGEFILWPTTHQTISQDITCLSFDGVVIRLKVSFQYTVEIKAVYNLTMKFVDFSAYNGLVRLYSRSAIRHACSKFTAQEYQTQRGAVQKTMRATVVNRMAPPPVQANVLELQLTNIERPEGYETVVDLKEKARTDINRVQNQRAQSLPQANTNLLKARVEANKTLDTAQATATITLNKANADASVTLGRYVSQGTLYKQVRQTQGLSAEGLLAYLGTRLVDELPSITVGLAAPARSSYASSLNATGNSSV